MMKMPFFTLVLAALVAILLLSHAEAATIKRVKKEHAHISNVASEENTVFVRHSTDQKKGVRFNSNINGVNRDDVNHSHGKTEH